MTSIDLRWTVMCAVSSLQGAVGVLVGNPWAWVWFVMTWGMILTWSRGDRRATR